MIKDKIKALDLSATLKINEISKSIELSGKEVIKFGFGQSPFQVPEDIVEELKKNAHQKSYLPIQGLEKLREAISGYESRKKNIIFSTDQVMVGPGSKELMFLLHICFNGKILLPTPSWVSYKPQAIIAENKYQWIKTKAENLWFPTADDIEKAVLNNEKTENLLILNSPNNPSGQVCQNLEDLSKVILKYNITVLSDEIYSELTFQNKYNSLAKFCPNNVIISNGLSKWCGAGGWRLGFFAVPPKLKPIGPSTPLGFCRGHFPRPFTDSCSADDIRGGLRRACVHVPPNSVRRKCEAQGSKPALLACSDQYPGHD